MPGYLYAYKKFKTRFEAPIVAEGDEQARHDLHMMGGAIHSAPHEEGCSDGASG